MGLKTRGNYHKSPVFIGSLNKAFVHKCPASKLTRSAYTPGRAFEEIRGNPVPVAQFRSRWPVRKAAMVC